MMVIVPCMRKDCSLFYHTHTHTHSVVQQLSLIGCGVSPIEVQHISEMLCNVVQTCNITKLNLSDNENVSL